MKSLKMSCKPGQTLAEYALLVALVGLGCLAALTILGAQIQETTEDMSTNGTAGFGGIMGNGG